jgi:hypothetical protein
MGKLHELLAVHTEVAKTARALFDEAVTTFSKKHEHFEAINKVYVPTEEDGDTLPEENKDMVTTVRDKLDYVEAMLVRELDIMYQTGATNTQARADLIMGGVIVAHDIPVTVLLEYENKFKEIRQMYREIPTYEPGERWVLDAGRKNCYVSDRKQSIRTTKKITPVILAPATDKHPAQVEKQLSDVKVGVWTTTKWSGKLSPREKADLLGRLDTVIESLKTARMRANDVEHATGGFAKRLFEYVNTGVARPEHTV